MSGEPTRDELRAALGAPVRLPSTEWYNSWIMVVRYEGDDPYVYGSALSLGHARERYDHVVLASQPVREIWLQDGAYSGRGWLVWRSGRGVGAPGEYVYLAPASPVEARLVAMLSEGAP